MIRKLYAMFILWLFGGLPPWDQRNRKRRVKK